MKGKYKMIDIETMVKNTIQHKELASIQHYNMSLNELKQYTEYLIHNPIQNELFLKVKNDVECLLVSDVDTFREETFSLDEKTTLQKSLVQYFIDFFKGTKIIEV
jgi:hypothetical protein